MTVIASGSYVYVQETELSYIMNSGHELHSNQLKQSARRLAPLAAL